MYKEQLLRWGWERNFLFRLKRFDLDARSTARALNGPMWLVLMCCMVPARLLSSYCTMDDYCEAPMVRPESYPPVALPGLRLAQVIVIIRHGDRTPVTILEDDPMEWEDEVDFRGLDQLAPVVSEDINLGLLTRKGAAQELELGQTLRAVYEKRMMPFPQVHLRSTKFSRTWLSAKYVAEGLTGRTDFEVEVRPPDQDSLMVNEQCCPRLTQVIADAQKGPEFKRLGQQMISLENFARRTLGLRLRYNYLRLDDDDRHKDLKGHYTPPGSAFFELADQFFTHSCYPNKPSLTGIKKEIGEEFCKVSRRAWELTRRAFSKNPLHSRLRLGQLIQELYSAQLEALFNNEDSSRFILLGAHDTTLAHLNTALETGRFEWPPYASNFVIETWKSTTATSDGDSDGHYIRVIYNGKLVEFPWAPPRSDGLVRFETFSAFIRHLLPTPYECSVL